MRNFCITSLTLIAVFFGLHSPAEANLLSDPGFDTMAVQEINSNGGINGKRIVVMHEDSQGDSKKSISAFQKLTDLKKKEIDYFV